MSRVAPNQVRGRSGAVEPRITSSGLKPLFSSDDASPALGVSRRSSAINRKVAWRAIYSVACFAVVNAGHDCFENGLSSKPAIDRS